MRKDHPIESYRQFATDFAKAITSGDYEQAGTFIAESKKEERGVVESAASVRV